MRYLSFVVVAILVIFAFILRVYKVDTNPPGLYLDEVSIGLNAYDILTTGKDQFSVPHPLEFAAYGEYKMPVYIYLVSGAMYIFGKSEFAIRFPSVLFGSLTVGVFFFLFKVLLEREIKNKKTILILSSVGALLLATSTWHLQFSRAGFEASVALIFYSSSLLLLTYFWLKKRSLYYFLAGTFLVLTFYTYDGYRLLVPLTTLGSWIVFWKEKQMRKGIIIASALMLCASLPLILFTFTQHGLMRFSETSAFSQYHYRYFWQQILADIVTYCRNYVSFFSITFLFTLGDQINRHQVQGFGLLYFWQLPFLVLGLTLLPKLKTNWLAYTLIFLLLSAPLVAALTTPSPHTLRFLMAIIPFTFLTVLGLYKFSLLLQKRKVIRLGIFLIIAIFAVIQFAYYIDYYYIHYSKNAIFDWGGECKTVAQRVQSLQKQFNTIYVEDGFMCIGDYFSFYTPGVVVEYISFGNLPPVETGQKILFIKHKNKEIPKGQLIENIYEPNLNHDVFAEFWKL